MTTARPEVIWSTEKIEVDGATFLTPQDADVYMNIESESSNLVLIKNRTMIDLLLAITAGRPVDRIVEIGIFKGGSAALLATLFRPTRLTALELSLEPVDALHDFVVARGFEDVVHAHYGVDQSDEEAVLKIVEGDHGAERLDLVIDDASHLYRETKRSFEMLFPRLRPGGHYVIEDWGWAHFDSPLWQQDGGWWHDRPALTNLLVELLMILARNSGLVAKVDITQEAAVITRGSGCAATSPVRLEDHYLNRGLPFRPIM